MEYKYLFVYFIGYLEIKKAEVILLLSPSCGGLTRTDDLWVMSPTSYQLLHSAMFISQMRCKGTAFI